MRLAGAVSAEVQARIDADWGIAPLVAGLVGTGCEIASRNRGGDVYVAPLVGFDWGMWAWLGFRQEWANEPASGRMRCYSYRSTTLTIHVGFRNVRYKPQILRAEWAGWADWNGVGYGAQGGSAGHPHWQFDAVESLRTQMTERTASTYLAVLKQEADVVGPRAFSPGAVRSAEVDDIVTAMDFSRIHLASVAPWWKKSPGDTHAYFPSSAAHVEAWVRKTMGYTVEELSRLQ